MFIEEIWKLELKTIGFKRGNTEYEVSCYLEILINKVKILLIESI
jgi:hypothetical protein